jgi:NDP-sugar pyrophosphorylase family protein
LLLNGDSYCDLDLAEFENFHRERAGDVSIALAKVENASRFGRVIVGSNDRVERFEEKNPAEEPGWINAGIYLFRRRLLEAIATNRPVSMEREVLPACIAHGNVFGFRDDGRFIDIGVPESYDKAEAFFFNMGRE